MRLPTLALVAGLLALSTSPVALGRPDTLDDTERKPPAKCWTTRTQSPYRAYGYDHIVEVTNACDKPITCSIRTNVNPEATSASVGAHETVSVVTFRGSPASEFTADVKCSK